jgi:hypothetical protein
VDRPGCWGTDRGRRAGSGHGGAGAPPAGHPGRTASGSRRAVRRRAGSRSRVHRADRHRRGDGRPPLRALPGFSGSGFPPNSQTSAPGKALEAIRQLSERLAARPIGEQVVFAVPLALIPIATGALLALLLQLRDRRFLSRILSFALLASFGAALFFALHELLSALLAAPPPALGGSHAGGTDRGLLREETAALLLGPFEPHGSSGLQRGRHLPGVSTSPAGCCRPCF